eukprot:500306-Pleurochrysis_carterae.AAC.1
MPADRGGHCDGGALGRRLGHRVAVLVGLAVDVAGVLALVGACLVVAQLDESHRRVVVGGVEEKDGCVGGGGGEDAAVRRVERVRDARGVRL